jgi:hypothetical protein
MIESFKGGKHTPPRIQLKPKKKFQKVSKGFKFENKRFKKKHSMTNLDLELILVGRNPYWNLKLAPMLPSLLKLILGLHATLHCK